MGKSEYLTYKGKPLVRCGKTLYYGSMADKYVIKMDVKDTKKIGGFRCGNQGYSAANVYRS